MAEANEFHGLINEAIRVVTETSNRGDQDQMSLDWDLSMIAKTRETGDSDLLRSIIKYADISSVYAVRMFTEALRKEHPGDVSHLIDPNTLTAVDEVKSVAVLGRWNETMSKENGDLLVEHTMNHPEDAVSIVHLIKDRNLNTYEEILDMLSEMKQGGSSALAQGTL